MSSGKDEESNVQAPEEEITNPYSWQIGFIYVFNLIIGAGVLALPKAFAKVGWCLGLISIGVLALMSFVTVSFITESMALGNALLRYQKQLKKGIRMTEYGDVVQNKHAEEEEGKEEGKEENVDPDTKEEKGSDDKPTITVKSAVHPTQATAQHDDTTFDITVKLELGDMASLFFNRAGVILYYLSICIYLYGSAAVYGAIIGKSLTTVTCDDPHVFDAVTDNANASVKMCKRFPTVSASNMYRIMLSVFVIVICPFAYFEIKNTKILQIFTSTYRWLSMFSMIILAFCRIGKANSTRTTPIAHFELSELPNFFGVALYAFMCQHSIPAVTTPVSDKRRLNTFLAVDFLAVLLFYSMLLMSSVFGFDTGEIDDVYTLNFLHPLFFKYLLQLFPVLTLSASFPIFSIVLRENIKNLFLTDPNKKHGIFVERILFSSVSIVPPLIVAYLTHDVGELVKYTGSYAGAVIQYVVPAALVYFGRRKVRTVYGSYTNKYRSWFSRNAWVYFIMFWYLLCMVFVTYNIATEGTRSSSKPTVGPMTTAARTIGNMTTSITTTLVPMTTVAMRTGKVATTFMETTSLTTGLLTTARNLTS